MLNPLVYWQGDFFVTVLPGSRAIVYFSSIQNPHDGFACLHEVTACITQWAG